jgi:hypothetical protein
VERPRESLESQFGPLVFPSEEARPREQRTRTPPVLKQKRFRQWNTYYWSPPSASDDFESNRPMIADQINHAREANPNERRFPFPSQMESLASQARPAAVLWLAGFLQAARLHRVVSFCARSSASVQHPLLYPFFYNFI